MKIPGRSERPPIVFPRELNAAPDSDLLSKRKPPRRKYANGFSGAGLRLKRDGASSGRSRPETPLLKWKLDDGDGGGGLSKEEKPLPGSSRKVCRRGRRGPEAAVSARKLAAGLWRLRSLEDAAGGGEAARRWENENRLGFQPSTGHVGGKFISQNNCQAYKPEAKELMLSPLSFSGVKNGFDSKHGSTVQIPHSAMEGATKWDPVQSNESDEVHRFCSRMNRLDQQVSAVSMVSALKSELEQAHARIQELEAERRSSKKKLEQFMRKLNEEKATWRRREHEKIRAVIDGIKSDLNRERKNRQRMELVNSKLVSELADAKFSAKRFMQDYEKERKNRELVEEVCDELAKEIGKDKAELEALKRESMKLQEEVEDERKMLQMAEVWREERVQMKLVDAKVALDEKYSQMSKLVVDMKNFLRSKIQNPDEEEEMLEAEMLLQAAASVNIQELKEFSYEPANPDIFSALEDVNFSDQNRRESETCQSKTHTVSPDVNLVKENISQRRSNEFTDQNGDIEEDESGWETVSQPDRGSSFSPEGSDASFNKIHRNSNVSGSATESEENAGEGTPITEISEVGSVQTSQLKKSAISRFWRSCPNNGENHKFVLSEGMKGRLSNGRVSNGSAAASPDRGSAKGGLSPLDSTGHWSSPDTANPGMNRAKGCIEWPRSMQKGSLKAKLLEAKLESQKVQLRHVLKQKI